MGPTRREAKHMHWHRYRHPQANPWPAAKTENELGHLALSLRLFFPPPRPPSVLSSSAQSGAGLSLFAARPNISSSYSPHSLTHPPSPPPPARPPLSILGMAVEIRAADAHMLLAVCQGEGDTDFKQQSEGMFPLRRL